MNVTVGSTSPRVMIVDNFLTAHECDELIGAAREKLGPSTVSSQVLNKNKKRKKNYAPSSCALTILCLYTIRPLHSTVS